MTIPHTLFVIVATALLTMSMSVVFYDSVDGLGAEQAHGHPH
jgi:hypothetical protein